MALPHTQYVIAETSTPVSGVNNNQVKTVSTISAFWILCVFKPLVRHGGWWVEPFPVPQTHYVISDGQTELETKPVLQNANQAQSEQLEEQPANQQATTQYIITTTTNGNSEVHITKP